MKRKNLFSILFTILLTACNLTTISSPTSVSTDKSKREEDAWGFGRPPVD